MISIHPKTKALIFDCDGTIIDSIKMHNDAWYTIANRYKIKITNQDLINNNGLPTKEILQEVTKKSSKNFDIEEIVKEKDNLTEKNMKKIVPIKPIVDLIKNSVNKLTMVVISGSSEKHVFQALKALNIINYFKFIITADTNHPKKNTTEAFTLIAKKLNVECEECHVFEDGKAGLINSIKANMRVTDMRTIK